MIHVIVIINPFDAARGRKDYFVPYDPKKPVCEYHCEKGEKLYAVNGVRVEPTATLKDGQEVIVAPRLQGKVFKWVLAIGLVVGGAMLGGAAASAVGWLKAARIAGALAMSMVGNSLMTKLTAQKVDMSNTEQSNTYGWGTPQTLTGQGYVLPICFGKVKTAGLMLQRHVLSDGEKQYLNILYCLAEGPIDDVSDIKLNSNPIENYTSVETNIRNGVNTQSVIPEFNDSYADTALAYELNVGKWNTVTLDGNTAQGIEITLAFPSGLYYSNDSGNADYTTVTIQAQYRKKGDADWNDIPIRNENYTYTPSWAADKSGWRANYTWQEHYYAECRTLVGYETYTDWRGRTRYKYDEDGNKIPIYTYSMTYDEWKQAIQEAHLYDGIIRSKETSCFYRMYGIHDLEPAQYEVRVQCVNKERSDIRTANKVQWVAVTQVIYDDFSHPNKALLGLKALATDQLSGSDPSLTCVIERSTVYVWNPTKGAYENQAASNPAWAAYDILHGARHLQALDGTWVYEAEGIAAENMDYYAFKAWAEMCDKAGIQFNYLFDSAMKVWDAINYPCRVGRGSVIIVGTKISCIYDYQSEPVQLFTVANMKKDSFSNEYLSTDSRANCVEISFLNREKNYERDVLAVYSDDYDSDDAVSQPTQIELMGCTDAEQAYQYGKYKLRENKYEIRTVSFEAFADAIACEIGDVISIQSDITDWGVGGRIVSVDGDVITLDQDISSQGPFTSMLFRKNANDELVTVNVTATGTNSVTVSNPEGMEKGCVYALGKSGSVAKKFKVLSISTNMNEETRTITAVEYYPEVYDIDTDKVPDIVKETEIIEAPRNMVLSTEKYVEIDGTVTNLVHCAWVNPRQFNSICLEKSTDGTIWTLEKKFTQNENSYTFTALSVQTYYVRVYAVNDLGMRSEYVANNITTDGQDALPPDVEVITAEKMASGLRRYWWKFTYPYPDDIAGFRIKYTQGTELNWDAGIPVQSGLIATQPYETQTVRQGTHTVMIKAVDNGGNESKNFAYCVLDLGDLLEENVLVRQDFTENVWANIRTNGTKAADGYIHAKDTSYMWSDSTNRMWGENTSYKWSGNFVPYDVTASFPANASGQFWLKYDIDGPAAVYYRKGSDAAFWEENADGTAVWNDETAVFWDNEESSGGENFWVQYSDRLMITKGEVIQIRVHALNSSSKETVVKSLEAIIDVPDRNEHFEDISISADGTTLPIVTPNYKTTAVHLDAIQESTAVSMKIVSRTPCIVQLIDASGNGVDGVADISWQGYEEDV